MSIHVIAEIGINHSGSLDNAKRLIKVAYDAGADIVKFQKRTVEKYYKKSYLDSPRESPFGRFQRDQKLALEFNREQYDEIDRYCKELGIEWTASAWDLEALKFLDKYNLKYNKVASAMIFNRKFLQEVALRKKYTFISTGMATLEKTTDAVKLFLYHGCPFELMYCVSSYPAQDDEINLTTIDFLKKACYCICGYSGHETGLQISLAAVAMGATSIERHITLDRTAYGSDQAASLEPEGFKKLVRDIRIIEKCMGPYEKTISEKEFKIKQKFADVAN